MFISSGQFGRSMAVIRLTFCQNNLKTAGVLCVDKHCIIQLESIIPILDVVLVMYDVNKTYWRKIRVHWNIGYQPCLGQVKTKYHNDLG